MEVKNIKWVAILVLFPVVVYAACKVFDGPSFNTHVGAVANGAELATKVQSALGGQFGRDVGVEGRVSYTAKLPLGLRGGLHSIPVTKACGETFKEALDAVYSPPATGGGGGGGGGSRGGGGTGSGGGPISGGCHGNCGGTVTVRPDQVIK